MGRERSRLAFASCGVLVRLIGQASQGHSGAPKELARRTGTGPCPRGTSMTHVALSPRFVVGSADRPKVRGVELWMERESSDGRRLAAHSYNMAGDYPPSTWDWATAFFFVGLPFLLLASALAASGPKSPEP